MGRYVCYDCGEEFDYPRIVSESRGEFWGMPAFEEMGYCPYCGSECWDEVISKTVDVEEDDQV